jgi:hypothetical protein
MKFKSGNSFSNSKFKLINIKNTIYLRKFLRSSSSRNIQSIIKQNNFKDLKIAGFQVISAKVKTTYTVIKNKKYYDMFFYDGISGDEILQRANVNEINFLKHWIEKSFFTKKIRNFCKLDPNVYLNKLNDIVKKIKNKRFLIIFTRKYIPDFKNLLNSQNIYYPKVLQCHGDLTLANMIVNYTKKKLILFDFLKTYNDNIVQDYAKLYQEFKLGWSGRYFDSIQNTRSLIVYQNIISDNQWRSLDIKLKKAIIIETYMTLFRILPYINLNDKLTFNWLLQSLTKLKKIHKTNNL